MKWDPGRYLKFGDERTRPAADLLARVPVENPRRVVDLGCGPGNSTRLLVERWPDAEIVGVDRSAEMLTAALAESDLKRVNWVEAAVEDWTPDERPEVIYSNAMLQYVKDHAQFLPRLLSLVAPGGALAVQIPYRMPGQLWVNELHATARGGPWSERFTELRWGEPSPAQAEYYDYLAGGAAQIDLWTTEYLHVLSGDDPVLQWTRGTALLPFLAQLTQEERPRFEAAYSERLRAVYPRRADGKTLFPFTRLFFVATAKE